MNRFIERHVVVGVDDEPWVLSALRRCLRGEPLEFLTTECPGRALEWVRTREVSLVITDQRMPGMSGSELLEEVSKRSPSTARIILTAYPESTFALPGVRLRSECLVSKPWDNIMLVRTIRRLLHERELDLRHEEEAGLLGCEVLPRKYRL